MHPHASAHKHAAEHTPVGAPVSAAEADFKVSHNMTLHDKNRIAHDYFGRPWEELEMGEKRTACGHFVHELQAGGHAHEWTHVQNRIIPEDKERLAEQYIGVNSWEDLNKEQKRICTGHYVLELLDAYRIEESGTSAEGAAEGTGVETAGSRAAAGSV